LIAVGSSLYSDSIYREVLYQMPSVNAQIKRGSAELAVLTLLAEHPLHGYEIAKQIEAQTGGVLSFDMASLYPMLYRLERKRWVKAEWQTLPNGRRRRSYRLMPAGQKQIAPLCAEWRAFFQALQTITGFQNA
jgi:PadR family transcriptional regulator, regulatory protein PadR